MVGVQVVEVHLSANGLDAVFIGRAVSHTTPDSSTGHPEGEPAGVVVSAVGLLDMRRPPEFSAPDDQRVV